MKHTYTKVLVTCGLVFAEVFFMFTYGNGVVHAATKVSGDLSGTVMWDKAGSPYIFEGDVNILSTTTLYVGPGTSITSDPKINPPSLVVRGNLILDGSPTDTIDISALIGISGSLGAIDAHYIRVHDGPNFSLLRTSLTISSSTISNSSSTAFVLWGGSLHGWGNTVTHMQKVVAAQTFSSPGPNTGDPDISLSNSSFTDNQGGIDSSRMSSVVHAENNWWGNSGGPLAASTTIIGNVSYDPWLITPPNFSGTPSVCCSSILFIPGLEASRLYKSKNQLWEPGSNKDVTALYLDQNGSSTLSGIYSGLPIDYGLNQLSQPIYGSFMNFLGSLVSDKIVNEWRPFAYDWRKPVIHVVLGDEQKSTTSESLIDVVQKLATNSRTGKVTIIAHSNGGLIAKYLIKTLTDLGQQSLIDSVISVAVPYLGTPQAIAGLLHGDDQSILGGLILSASNARNLGMNMASAYSLLPSASYFTQIFSPTIAFATTSIAGLNNGSYPIFIATADDQKKFINDENHVRMQPASTDLTKPIIGNSYLNTAANLIHSLIDPFIWPDTIARFAIIGWNELTTRGISYSQKDCLTAKRGCTPTIVHDDTKTLMGDGTVVAKSAAYNSGQPISVDLNQASITDAASSPNGGVAYEHANILESKGVQSSIRKIIQSGTTSNVLTDIAKIPAMSVGEPDYSKDPGFLEISTHSPVELNVYDSQGRHTGLIPKPESLKENDAIEAAFEKKIPLSSFSRSGNPGDYDTYIWLPNSNGEQYKVVIKGIGNGSFEFDAKQWIGGKEIESVQFEEEPSSLVMIATTTIGGNLKNGRFTSIASTTPFLHVDENGDGKPDHEAKAHSHVIPAGTVRSN